MAPFGRPSWLLWVWFATNNGDRRAFFCHLRGHSSFPAQFRLPFPPCPKRKRPRPQCFSLREGPPFLSVAAKNYVLSRLPDVRVSGEWEMLMPNRLNPRRSTPRSSQTCGEIALTYPRIGKARLNVICMEIRRDLPMFLESNC